MLRPRRLSLVSSKLEAECQGVRRLAVVEPEIVGNVDEVVRQCGESGALEEGRRLHHGLIASGHLEQRSPSGRYVANLLIQMYGKCGSVADARAVFEGMAEETRNTFTWNIMLTAYARNGHMFHALLLFNRMLLHGLRPNCVTFTCLISSCSSPLLPHPHRRHLHHLLTAAIPMSDRETATALLNMYARWGDMRQARRVFDAMVCSRDTVTWNAIISAYAHGVDDGDAEEAVRLFSCMLLDGVGCNHVTFLALLRAHSAASHSHPAQDQAARRLQALVTHAGYHRHPFIANCMVNMYSKCGAVADARGIFDEAGGRDVISWNTIISAYSHRCPAQALHLFHTMLAQGSPRPDRLTFLALLDACTTLAQGRRMHSLLLLMLAEAEQDVKLQTVVMSMYSRCGSMEDAAGVFGEWIRSGAKVDVVCWNSLMAGYARNGQGREALQVLRRMDLVGCKANKLSLMSALEACDQLPLARRLHHRLMALTSTVVDVAACSALVHMYGRCGSLADARAVFGQAEERNVVAWTALIGALADNGRCGEAAECVRMMEHEGVRPNQVTLVSTIDACDNAQAGLALHRRAAESGVDSDVCVANSLITMYGRCGRVEDAQAVFDGAVRWRRDDMITWNALMSALSHNGEGRRAVELYWRMMGEGVKSDRVTFITLVDACATLASLPHGRAVHCHLAEAGFDRVDLVLATLVNMYGRCGSASDSKLAFDSLQRKDVISWNAALVNAGHAPQALKLLQSMEMEGVKPDLVTFVTLLATCAHHTALFQGKLFHARLAALPPDVVLGNALLNMYGKCGSVGEAEAVFACMAERNMVSWNTMIVAYSQNGHVRSAIRLFREMDMEGIFPNHVSFITILFACSHAGLLEEGRLHFQYMTGEHGIVPTPEHYGCFVDLLARTGRLGDAEELMSSMPLAARSFDWSTLLGAAAVQANAERAERAINHIVNLNHPNLPAASSLNVRSMI